MTTDHAIVKDEDAEISFDRSFFPIIINKWVNAPTIKMGDEYHTIRNPMIDEAERKGTKLVVISDLSRFKAPPSTVRKYLADLAIETDSREGFHGYVVIVPNALLRGVVTAITWMTGDKTAPTLYASELGEAVHKAAGFYPQLGLEPPDISGFRE